MLSALFTLYSLVFTSLHINPLSKFHYYPDYIDEEEISKAKRLVHDHRASKV